jgi:ABC-type nitrate/sulfonate/bicarbonate transport system substrate-binding protein
MDMAETLTRRRLLARTSGAAALGLCGGAPALAAGLPIRIANAAGALNLTMAALMKQQKYLEAFGLDPDMLQVPDGSKSLSGIVGGGVDASFMSGFGQVFPAIERGAKLKVIGGGALLPELALFTGKATVNSLKDIEGKTVGTGSIGALVYQLTAALLRKKGVDISKVQFVNVGSSADVFRAVTAGTVDVGSAPVALIPAAGEYKVRYIPGSNMAEELPEYTYQGAWTSDRKIATDRDRIVRALAAYGKLYRFVHQPQAKDAFIAARRSAFPNAPASDHDRVWVYIQTYKPFAVNLGLTPERLRYMQELNVGFKVQQKVLPFERVADMTLARDAVKLLGGPA